MAAAAAAAAAVTAAIQVLGAKQYTTAYNETVPLKDTNFDEFDKSLYRAAFSHTWANWTIDPAFAEPARLVSAVTLVPQSFLRLREKIQEKHFTDAKKNGASEFAYAQEYLRFH